MKEGAISDGGPIIPVVASFFWMMLKIAFLGLFVSDL
jgi:hypothetical protein